MFWREIVRIESELGGRIYIYIYCAFIPKPKSLTERKGKKLKVAFPSKSKLRSDSKEVKKFELMFEFSVSQNSKSLEKDVEFIAKAA